MRIFLWSIKDDRLWLLAWSVGAAAVVGFIVFLFPAMSEMMKGFLAKEAIIKAFMGRFAPQMIGKSYFDVWLCLEFFAWFGVLVGAYPLIFASGAISAEVERRTMEMLLAQPVSRTRVLLQKFAALMVGMLVICAASYGALGLAAAVWIEEEASYGAYVYIFLNKYFLLFATASFGFTVSVLIDEQRLSLSLAFGVIFIQFLAYKILTGAGVLLWLARLTPYYYSDSTKIIALEKIDWSDNLVLFTIGIVFLGAAIALFARKDIAR